MNFYKDLENCKECVALDEFGYHRFPSRAHGNPGAYVWIVGIDPRRIAGQVNPSFWTGRSSANLRQPIENAFGEPLENLFYLTDLIKCQKPGRRMITEMARRCPERWFQREIEALCPKAGIILGKDAAEIVQGAGFAKLFQECHYLPHPSPANGKTIRRQFGSWEDYRRELVGTCRNLLTRWKQNRNLGYLR